MRPFYTALIVLFYPCLRVFSQTDSTLYLPERAIEDGIYITYNDFRNNRGIKKQQIVSNDNKNQLEFLSKVIFEDKFSYDRSGVLITVESKNAWGYFQNNTLYVNFKGDFYRVPVFGSISYLVANVTVINPGFYDPRFGMSTGGAATKEIREFLINFYDGRIIEFTLKTAEQLLARDPALYSEYKKLNKRKRKEQIYGFIRKYNALHPIYFLNN